MPTITTNKAESIFTILENGETSTMVKDEGYHTMVLPTTMPTINQFDTAGDLYDWTMEQGITHAVLQKGIQKHLIDLRAKFRLVKKGETWNLTTAQNNVDTTEWQVVTKPNQNNTVNIKSQAMLEAGMAMAKAMKATGLDNNMILASLTPVYGVDTAQTIIKSLS